MSRRVPFIPLLAYTLMMAACADRSAPTAPTAAVASAPTTPRAARERLAQQLARALADPALRAAVKHRLDRSNAPEGKLQFQALAHADQGLVLASLARAGARSLGELAGDLDAARGLELYLPVEAQRAAWPGDAHFLVATIGNDGEAPVAFDANGTRTLLDPKTPPDTPVLALVPQETDFTRGRPSLMMACVDMCGGDSGDNGGSGNSGDNGGTQTGTYGGGNPAPAAHSVSPVPGLYLIQSHFSDLNEGWLKGKPELEFHVYGVGDSGQSVQLACTGEQQLGAYRWDQNDSDWSGSALLLSDDDLNAYQAKHPGAPVRIVAWEDDNESCVDHADQATVTQLVSAVDAAYKSVTSGKAGPWYYRGIVAAPSIFSVITAAWNLIKTNDDFIGDAVATTVAGPAPGQANWLLKTDGTVTTGWFTTQHLP